jgi:hypothetical protein
MGRKEGLLRAISGFCPFRAGDLPSAGLWGWGAFGDGVGVGLFGCAALVSGAYGVGFSLMWLPARRFLGVLLWRWPFLDLGLWPFLDFLLVY